MKNKVLFAILFLVSNFNLVAQDFNKQYSVKATALLENKLGIPSSPYQITIKTLKEKSNTRFSAGINLNSSYYEGISTSISLAMRFGKERFIDFGKDEKWRLFYGLDFPFELNTRLNSSWVVGSFSAGIAPFAGLQFRINERLVLHTETNYELALSTFVSNRRGGQVNLRNKYRSPGSIWLGFELFKPKKKKSLKKLFEFSYFYM